MKQNQPIRSLSGLLFVLALCLAPVTGLGQGPAGAAQPRQKWIRAQSDNGEFSVEVPDEYDYSFGREGFTVEDNSGPYAMREMGVFNSYRDGALLSFESYETKDPGKAFSAIIFEHENRLGKIDAIKQNGKTFHQMVVKNEKYYLVRQYFISRTRLYILTAGARKEGSPAIDRFLKSIVLSGGYTGEGKIGADVPVVSFAALKQTPPILQPDGAKYGKNLAVPKTADPDEPAERGVSTMTIIAKPASYYTDLARKKDEQGLVQFQITFTANGGISRIKILKELQYGLTRHALISALRIKILPKEVNGKAEPVTRTISYGFQIY
jgi:hypothetical protein